MKRYPIFFFIILLAVCSCKKAGKPLEKPEIVFRALSHNTVVSGNAKDTVIISLRYSIAAANIGAGDTIVKVFGIDKRDDFQSIFPFPNEIDGTLTEEDVNISGNLTVKLSANQFFTLRPDHPNGDTLRYEIHLKDKNGVESNRVTTPDIYIVP